MWPVIGWYGVNVGSRTGQAPWVWFALAFLSCPLIYLLSLASFCVLKKGSIIKYPKVAMSVLCCYVTSYQVDCDPWPGCS